MKTPLHRLLVFTAIGFTACFSEPGEPDDSVFQTSQPIVEGVIDAGDSSVVAVVTYDASGKRFICTGAVIAPTKVLTARHCLEGAVSQEVRVGTDAAHPDAIWPVRGGVSSPDGDIAVLTLSTPTDLPALEYNVDALDQSSNGMTVRAVGYGSNKTDGEDRYKRGIKRYADTQLQDASDRSSTVAVHRAICHGDSGGPILESGRVIAVVSQVEPADCTGYGYSVRTDLHAAFIEWAMGSDPIETPDRRP